MSIKKALRFTLSKTRMGTRFLALRSLGLLDSHLSSVGWFESRAALMPVDRMGAPLPWYTYASTMFLEPRLTKNMLVFEYGSGNSTRWWSQRVSGVVSCEHDRAWFERVRGDLPVNVKYEFSEREGGVYAASIARQNRFFDVAVIDGRDRVACAFNVPEFLKSDGVVIWDNSDRREYQEGYDFLASLGFHRLDFWGMGPINTYAWCTSVFYRRENCLGI